MKRVKRIIWRDKTYGFHPWRDQVDAIDQIVKESGTKEAIVLRKLIDEALAARSRTGAHQEASASANADSRDTLRAIQALLVKLVEHADKAMRVQDVSLVLLQETLAEARAGRKVSWDQLYSRLKAGGLSTKDLRQRFADETAEARDFAYSTAKEIKNRRTK
jgi:hypothetical protein